MTVVYFQRKRAPGAFSIEGYFDLVRQRLVGVNTIVVRAQFYSTTIRGFLLNMIDAARRQGYVNHITGDVHYVSYLLRKRRTVLTIHDCGFEGNPSGLRRLILRWLWFIVPVRRVAIVTTNSQFTKDNVVRIARCNPAKVRVVPVCVSQSYKRVPKEFNADCPRIIHVGTRQNKNLERVIAALEDIECELHVIGELSASQRERLAGTRYRNSYNLREEDLVQAYANADIVSFVSTYEGFGMPIVEGNATGRPVIAGSVTAMPEVAGDAACLVDPYSIPEIREGFLRIIRDETYRAQLVENGFRNVRRFDPDEIAAQYKSIYTTILNGRSIDTADGKAV